MLFRTAMKIVLYEKEKFLGAVVGVTLALFLVILQSGFYLGYRRDITVILDSIDADVWIAPKGQLTFDGWDYIDDLAYYRLKGDPQVAQCSRLVLGYAPWRVPGSGGKDMVQVVGVDFGSAPLPASCKDLIPFWASMIPSAEPLLSASKLDPIAFSP